MITYKKTLNPQPPAWISSGEDYEARHWSAKLDEPAQQSKDVVKASGLVVPQREDPLKSRD